MGQPPDFVHIAYWNVQFALIEYVTSQAKESGLEEVRLHALSDILFLGYVDFHSLEGFTASKKARGVSTGLGPFFPSGSQCHRQD
jgi:hypothetical protein